MTADVELLPCPFCGAGKTEIRENGRPWLGMRYGDPSSVSVRHWCEPIEGQPSRMIERVGRDRAAAIAAWNTRATDANLAALQAENERLRAEVELWRHKAAVHQYRRKRLAEALRNSSDALERLAFAIRAPNAHTPQLVELAIAMRAAALEAFRDGTTSPVTSPVRILIDAIESEIRQLEGKSDWKSQAARIASLRAAIDQARGKGGGEVGP